MKIFCNLLLIVLIVFSSHFLRAEGTGVRFGIRNYNLRCVIDVKDLSTQLPKPTLIGKTIKIQLNTGHAVKSTAVKKIPQIESYELTKDGIFTLKMRNSIKIEKVYNLIKDRQKPRIVIDISVLPRVPLIVIDPGHGGKDPGTKSISGVFEKNLTLSIAKQLKEELIKTKRYQVVLTRTNDDFVKLSERKKIAHDSSGDLFVSLHADNNPNQNVHGISVYTLSAKASDKEAEEIAKRENEADELYSKSEDNVSDILADLVTRETQRWSLNMAHKLVRNINSSYRLVPNTHRYASLKVLKSPDMPSVLVEMGCLSNKKDDALLRSNDFRKRLIQFIIKSIDQHFLERKV